MKGRCLVANPLSSAVRCREIRNNISISLWRGCSGSSNITVRARRSRRRVWQQQRHVKDQLRESRASDVQPRRNLQLARAAKKTTKKAASGNDECGFHQKASHGKSSKRVSARLAGPKELPRSGKAATKKAGRKRSSKGILSRAKEAVKAVLPAPRSARRRARFKGLPNRAAKP